MLPPPPLAVVVVGDVSMLVQVLFGENGVVERRYWNVESVADSMACKRESSLLVLGLVVLVVSFVGVEIYEEKKSVRIRCNEGKEGSVHVEYGKRQSPELRLQSWPPADLHSSYQK